MKYDYKPIDFLEENLCGHCFLVLAWIVLWIPLGSWQYKLVKNPEKGDKKCV